MDLSSNILAEFAELSTSPDLAMIQKEVKESMPITPLSGCKLMSMPDGSSPYLKCFRYFSQSSISPLIEPLEKITEPEKEDPITFKSKISNIIRDPSVWPVVWTCFGRSCHVQYSKDDFSTQAVSLGDPTLVDNSPFFQEFQRYWSIKKEFVLVSKEIISSAMARITVCSTINSDRHASHLVVTLPIHHPFFVVNKGWCQVDSRSIYFKSLSKMDVISFVEGECIFTFPPKGFPSLVIPDQPESLESKERTSFYPSPASVSVIQNNSFQTSLPNYDPFMAQYVQQYGLPLMYSSINFANLAFPQSFPVLYPNNQPQNQVTTTPAVAVSANHKGQLNPEDIEVRKRPMNGFMLFAKSMRLKLINENPGKDNRVISQMLGKKWKLLKKEEKQRFIEEAKLMSVRRMQLNPLCWKRKNPPKRILKKNEKLNASEKLSDTENDVQGNPTLKECKMSNKVKDPPFYDYTGQESVV